MALHLMAAMLRQGRSLNAMSRLAMALPASWLLLQATGHAPTIAYVQIPLLVSLLLGLTQMYFAIRVDIDARLLRELARAAGLGGGDLAPATAELDYAFQAQGLLASDKPVADWPQRLSGARRLWQRQILALVLQLAALAVALMLAEQNPLNSGLGQ